MAGMTDTPADGPGAYFERLGSGAFRATPRTGGGWNPQEQHIGPVIGLLAHLVELDHGARRAQDRLRLVRLSYDILGTLPIEVVDVHLSVLRAGRTVELVQARLGHGGRDAVVLRAWLAQRYDTGVLEGSALAPIEALETMPAWDASAVWPGGFTASVQARRREQEPGRAAGWVRTDVPLLAGEEVCATARALVLVDLANGLTPRAPTEQVAFPNLDLTVHLYDEPALDEAGGWVGLDTAVSFGPSGLGLTQSTVHDARGPFATVAQCLTVRPRA